MKVIPGDPFNDPKLKPEIKQALIEKYGLDRPIMEQYNVYIKNLLKGEFGTSIKYEGRSVSKIIKENFPISFMIGWRALVFAVSFGIIFGVIAAVYHQRAVDYIVILVAIIGVSVPSIVIGPFFSYIFGVKIRLFPVTVDKTYISLLLPSVTLGLGTLAIIARMMRTTTLEVLGQDYIQTAKAKGLNKVEIIFKHTIRNSIMPVITILGRLFAAIITGSIVIEKVFSAAGIGEYFVSAILELDYPMIMGITIFYAILIIICMLMVDICYGFIDPRLKLSAKGRG
jgi:oligopeptide transport system permease protein